VPCGGDLAVLKHLPEELRPIVTFCRIEPIENPFEPKVLPMCPE